MSPPVVQLADIIVRYGDRPVLRVPSLGIERGETLAVIGPNGSGKSTLLRVIGLLEPPTEGSVLLEGQAVDFRADLVSLRRRMATVFQEALLCDATVHQNVALPLRLRHLPPPEVRHRAAEWMDRLGIARLAGRRSRTLSGGEAQRTSLARAFAAAPELLLLDEPFAALDPPTKGALMADLDTILRETGVTAVFVTHDREEALRLGDRVAVMFDGLIEQVAGPEAIFGRPATPEVARFVGVENILSGRVLGGGQGLCLVGVGDSKLEVLGDYREGERVFVCIRPEDVTFHLPREPVGASSARNRLEGRIVRLVPMGSQYRIELDCGYPMVGLLTKQSREDLGLAEGGSVAVSFKASAAHVFRRG